MAKIPVVFFGAGPVAAESLKLLTKNFDIEAVITKGGPDKKVMDYPVINIANTTGAKIFFASNKKEVDEVCANNKFCSPIGVLIDFGVIVSEEAINTFPKGIINSHFSLLPEWRGADPITYSLLSGQKITGVTLMMLSKGMDEGPVLEQDILSIDDDDTGVSLTEKLIKLSSAMLEKNIPLYLEEKISATDQMKFAQANNQPVEPTYSSKITKKQGEINWSKSAELIEREIRAYQPWPRSFTTIGEGLSISVFKARIDRSIKLDPGQIKIANGHLFIGTASSAIELLEIQPAGKKKMLVEDFLRGYSNKLFVRIN